MEFGEPSALDPYCEFPVLEILGGSYFEGLTPGRRVERKGGAQVSFTGPKAVFLAEVDKKAFEPSAFLHYDRPIFSGKPIISGNWPEKATAWRLTPEELTAYRARTAIELHLTDFIELQVEIEEKIHARMLPPACNPGDRPLVRILGLRVEKSDLSRKA